MLSTPLSFPVEYLEVIMFPPMSKKVNCWAGSALKGDLTQCGLWCGTAHVLCGPPRGNKERWCLLGEHGPSPFPIPTTRVCRDGFRNLKSHGEKDATKVSVLIEENLGCSFRVTEGTQFHTSSGYGFWTSLSHSLNIKGLKEETGTLQGSGLW